MIESISIRNLGVIKQAQLELGPGFTAITGETGAGKTMVLTALDLVLGGRADSTAIRKGEPSLFVEGIWRVGEDFPSEQVSEMGAELEGGELIVNRTVTTEGRSRAVVSGVTVPVGALAGLAESLVAVHGQSEQIRLRSQSAQREALDDFGGEALRKISDAYRVTFQNYRELEKRIERLRNSNDEDLRRVSEIKEFLSDLSKLDPKPEEEIEVAERISRLSNVESLRQAASIAHEALSSEGEYDAVTLTGSARKALENASSNDPELVPYVESLRIAGETINEVSTSLASYLQSLDADPRELEELMNRKSALAAFSRKYSGTVEELLQRAPLAQAELMDLESSEDQIEKLEQQFAALEAQLSHAASELTKSRTVAAQELATRVNAELAGLAMAGANLEIRITPLSDFELSGLDRIEFLLAAHPGAEPRPLGKGASGGELSRIMLAIELVLVGNRPLPTLIFDEVDAGVGGNAAVELGRRLKALSKATQVIVVTHLPQVAAFADTQLRVKKNVDGEFTATSVEILEGEGRVEELARMLSGSADSEVARAHAKELLETK